MYNRLRLDFSLQTAEERREFLNKYLPTIKFTPNEHEAETLADYLLWGKNKEGLNAQQEGDVVIKQWAQPAQVTSYDELLEVPGFQESTLRRLDDTVYKPKKTVFNREQILKQASPDMAGILQNLFRDIDETELIINYYELKTGKRVKPPRDALLARFTEDEQFFLQQQAESISPRKYLKLRHLLVELRAEQYNYKDMIISPIQATAEHSSDDPIVKIFRMDEDVIVRPFGLKNDNIPLQKKIFSWPLNPSDFTAKELEQLSNMIWHPKTGKLILDFEDPKHLLAVYENLEGLQEDGEEDNEQLYNAAQGLALTLKYYENITNLSSLQKEILYMKLHGTTNAKIRDYVNGKYGTTYNENYISTIYRQKILGAIAKTVGFHKRAIENIFYPENFKVCVDCGQLLPRNNDFFIKQKKAIDGLASRCKACQKRKREAAAIRDGRKKIIEIIDENGNS